MTRMTTWIRDEIVRNAVKKAGIPAEQEKLEKRKKVFAEQVRLDSLGGPKVAKKIDDTLAAIRELLNGVDAKLILPAHEHGINISNYLVVSFAGCRTSISFAEYDPKGKNYKPCLNTHTLDANHTLTAVWRELENDEKDLREKQKTLEAEVYGALSSVTTVKKLLQAWPEVAELLPANAANENAQLPMVPVAKLNASIGLPSAKK